MNCVNYPRQQDKSIFPRLKPGRYHSCVSLPALISCKQCVLLCGSFLPHKSMVTLVQEPKCPERNLFAGGNVNVIYGKCSIGNIFIANLRKVFSGPAHFNNLALADPEIGKPPPLSCFPILRGLLRTTTVSYNKIMINGII